LLLRSIGEAMRHLRPYRSEVTVLGVHPAGSSPTCLLRVIQRVIQPPFHPAAAE
jgi:hypothetical protein